MNRRLSSDVVTFITIWQLSPMTYEIFCAKACRIHSLLLIYQDTTKQKEYEIVRYCQIEAVVIYIIKIFKPEDELRVYHSLVSNKDRFYFSLVGGTRAALCIPSTLCCRRKSRRKEITRGHYLWRAVPLKKRKKWILLFFLFLPQPRHTITSKQINK